MIFEIDDIIPFVRRNGHEMHTIRQIIRYDSGYLKDLFVNDIRVCFSEKCFLEILRLTKGHYDNWESCNQIPNIFNSLKTYQSPYLYDFNDESLIQLNKERLSNHK